jgi:5-methylcytosine-specific restriction endonuclease McrA
MTAGNGKPCKKCGTSEWNKWGQCLQCQREYDRKWYQENRNKAIANSRKWNRENAARALENHRKYRRRNPHISRDYHREWAARNPEKAKEAIRRWHKENPDRSIAYVHARRAKKKANGGNYTVAEWEALCEQYNYRCLKCGRGDRPLTVDHIMPIDLGGPNDIGNIQPLCGPCNSSKKNKHIDYRTKPGVERWIQPSLFDPITGFGTVYVFCDSNLRRTIYPSPPIWEIDPWEDERRINSMFSRLCYDLNNDKRVDSPSRRLVRTVYASRSYGSVPS